MFQELLDERQEYWWIFLCYRCFLLPLVSQLKENSVYLLYQQPKFVPGRWLWSIYCLHINLDSYSWSQAPNGNTVDISMTQDTNGSTWTSTLIMGSSKKVDTFPFEYRDSNQVCGSSYEKRENEILNDYGRQFFRLSSTESHGILGSWFGIAFPGIVFSSLICLWSIY